MTSVVLEGEVAYALPETELGNAQKFVARYGSRLRWVGAWGCWLIWDGRRWERDDCLQAQTLAKLLAISLPDVTSAKWGAISQRKRTIDATLSLAKDALAIKAEALDKDPFLLNCLNGTINLLTGELRPHDQADLITKLVPASFDPEAPAPRWEQFEREVFAGDLELIDYVRKAIAYSLCGDVRHQYLHLFYGDGENGKNKYLDTIRALFGDYACVAPDEILMETKGNEHPTGLAKLAGRRLVTCSETGDGKRLAESLVKRLTGEKTLTARYMHGNFFDFDVTFKLFLATNYQPQIKGIDRGIWRRIRLVPWKVTFSDEARPDQAPLVLPKDEGLGPKLEAEMPGILARLVKACVQVLNTPTPLAPPSAVQAATEEYRKESNQVGVWLGERCHVYRDEPMRTQVMAKTSELFRDFCDWCEQKRARPMNDKHFGRALTQLRIEEHRTSRSRFRLGIRLLEPDLSSMSDSGTLPYTDGPAF